MDVLNPSPALCLPQAMWLTYRVILERPDLSQEDLLDQIVPVAMRARTPGDGAHVRRALAGLREFRLAQISESGLYRVEPVNDYREFLRMLRYRLIAPPESLGSEFKGAPDLRSGLIWLLRQSPLVPLDFLTNVQVTMPTGLFTNDTRWNAFRQWCVSLGFGLSSLTVLATGIGQKATGQRVVPNPTSAVIDAIEHPFGEPLPRGVQLPIGQMLDYLRTEIPVLPGHPSATYPGLANESNELPALGLALSSAEEREVLVMEYQSDPSGVLALRDAQGDGRDRYVSAVTIRG